MGGFGSELNWLAKDGERCDRLSTGRRALKAPLVLVVVQHLLHVLEHVDVVAHDDEIAEVPPGCVAHVPVVVAHQLARSIRVRLDVLLEHRHLQRAQHLHQ